MYGGLFAAAGYPMTLGPSTEPGTRGVIPAPAGHYVFYSRVPGAIVYQYRRGPWEPVPVPERQYERRDIRLRLPPMTREQQTAVATMTAMTIIMMILVILLIPVGA